MYVQLAYITIHIKNTQGTYTPVSPYKEANGHTKGSGAGEVSFWG